MNAAKRLLLGASFAYLATALPGTWISLRDDLPGEPLGLRTGNHVRGDLVRGLGTALCAPAPMLLALGWLAQRSLVATGDDRGRVASLTGLGVGFLCGMAAEPITSKVVADPSARVDRTAVVAANLALPAVMIVAGLRHLARTGRQRQRPQRSEELLRTLEPPS